jgi:hypothetical protein
MKQSYFRVWFSNGNYIPEFVNVSAFEQGDALILAQAKRIKSGRDYTLLKIEEVKQ